MIEFTLEKLDGKNILSFKYGNMCYYGEMDEENGKFVTLVSEKPARQLMNLCMAYLRESKEAALQEEKKIEQKIKFYGVDY